jgi:hypothetical protein
VAAVQGALVDGVQQLKAGTTEPLGSTSIFSRPPAMSLTFLAKSFAYSWKMSLAGQVLWKRKVVVCARLTIGAARAAAPTAAVPVFFRKRRRCGRFSGAALSAVSAMQIS